MKTTPTIALLLLSSLAPWVNPPAFATADLEFPSSLDLGPVPLCSRALTTFYLENRGDTAITVHAIEFQTPVSPDLSVFSRPLPFLIPGGEDESIAITYTPSELGPLTAVLEIQSDAPTPLVTISISALGVEPPDVPYTFTDLLPPGWSQAYTLTINDQGTVLGYGTHDGPKLFLYHEGASPSSSLRAGALRSSRPRRSTLCSF
jgi:hypothetical protein